jgi:hypothetical protein
MVSRIPAGRTIVFYESRSDYPGIAMKVKYICFTLIMLLFSQAAVPQKKYRNGMGVKFDIRAGISLQNFFGKDFWGEELRNQFQPGFRAGAGVIIPIIPDFYLQTGILVHNKGSRQDTVAGSIKTTSLYYAEIPADLLFRPQLGDGHLLVGFGPYVGYGIFGRENIKTGNVTDRLRVKFIDDASGRPTSFAYYRPLDAGAEIIVGYEMYGRVFLQIEAQMGMLEINPSYGLANDKTSRRNIGFGFSGGYRF